MLKSRESIERLLENPTTHNWLKEQLLGIGDHDLLDLSRDVDTFAEICKERLEELFGQVDHG